MWGRVGYIRWECVPPSPLFKLDHTFTLLYMSHNLHFPSSTHRALFLGVIVSSQCRMKLCVPVCGVLAIDIHTHMYYSIQITRATFLFSCVSGLEITYITVLIHLLSPTIDTTQHHCTHIHNPPYTPVMLLSFRYAMVQSQYDTTIQHHLQPYILGCISVHTSESNTIHTKGCLYMAL